MLSRGGTIRLQIPSNYELLDFIQIVCDRVALLAALDEDSIHWIGVAVRESVINAIIHGNRNDTGKRVHVEFTPLEAPQGVHIRVRDEGPGFDPENVPDPLAPENLLKGSGRGIFLIRSFMDEMVLQRAAEGGMEMVMVKRCGPAQDSGCLSA